MSQPEEPNITIPREAVRALFDIAVSSMDFGSGFWDSEDVEAVRAIAVAIGVCPMLGTPDNFIAQYPPCEGMTRSPISGAILMGHRDHP